MRDWIASYIEAQKAALDSIPVEQVESVILKLKEAHAEGRQKWRNLCADDRVALSATDPSNPERYLEVRGRLVGWEYDGALELLDQLAMSYRGEEIFPRDHLGPLSERCTAVIEPLYCTTLG